MKIAVPVLLSVLSLGWIFYRLLVTRDLRRYKIDVIFGLTVIGIWIIFFWWMASVQN